ncbi:Pimeloyl-ACP methyl ester carboxylesterase [Pseudorhodobacter antarcticus]|uniref:Pimeloyl-ACP methyl ester carboxylesterase n=1 Tax=Pseudorhodobacter antarcticus TaxID=1077947 RepID=A0A1H8KY01_9RHOB|nr:Pimeloyl-ACP methyl ester carboxylesterase [Pseudorhodobacter antarcticus]
MISRKLAPSLLIAALALGGCAALVDRKATAREDAAATLYPPTGQFVTVNGTRIHADVQGAGPDLVLIHGASGSSRDFTFDLTRRLKSTYRVIAFDRPGMGWSDSAPNTDTSPLGQADLLIAAATQLGATHPIVLGHSYGGAVAMAWALRAKPTALVIVSGATMPFPGDLGLWYKVTSSTLGGHTIIPLITAFAPQSRIDASVNAVFAPQSPPAGYADYIGTGLTLMRDALRVNGRQVNSLKPYVIEMSKIYPDLTLPVELVHGRADTTVPLKIHAEPLSKLLPNATLTILDGAGHMPHHTHPDAIIAAINRAAKRAKQR